MTKITMTVLTLLLALLPLASVHGQAAQQSFGFNAERISGFPTGAAFLTGRRCVQPGACVSEDGWRVPLSGGHQPGPAQRLPSRRRHPLGCEGRGDPAP